METAITKKQKAEIKIPTPILDIIDKSLAAQLGKDLAEIAAETNRCIERGVKGSKELNQANTVVVEGLTAIKMVEEIFLQTIIRPIRAGLDDVRSERDSILHDVSTPNEILNGMVLDRDAEIRQEKADIKKKYEEDKAAAEAKAASEQTRRSNISKGLGGDGDVKPVAVEEVVQPISTIGMRSTVRAKTRPDKDKITEAINNGVRQIDGIKIYQVWVFKIENSKEVPSEYRKITR